MVRSGGLLFFVNYCRWAKALLAFGDASVVFMEIYTLVARRRYKQEGGIRSVC